MNDVNIFCSRLVIWQSRTKGWYRDFSPFQYDDTVLRELRNNLVDNLVKVNEQYIHFLNRNLYPEDVQHLYTVVCKIHQFISKIVTTIDNNSDNSQADHNITCLGFMRVLNASRGDTPENLTPGSATDSQSSNRSTPESVTDSHTPVNVESKTEIVPISPEPFIEVKDDPVVEKSEDVKIEVSIPIENSAEVHTPTPFWKRLFCCQ